MKTRKLQECYRFNIEINDFTLLHGKSYRGAMITKASDGKNLDKLTPAQWSKAKQYLTRELIPFQGYRYTPKADIKNGIYKII
jgi:hypothetical protein